MIFCTTPRLARLSTSPPALVCANKLSVSPIPLSPRSGSSPDSRSPSPWAAPAPAAALRAQPLTGTERRRSGPPGARAAGTRPPPCRERKPSRAGGGRQRGPARQRGGRGGGTGAPPRRQRAAVAAGAAAGASRAVPRPPQRSLPAWPPPPGSGNAERGGCGSRAGKMPLAQLADPWQKMAVESTAESSTEVRGGRGGAAGKVVRRRRDRDSRCCRRSGDGQSFPLARFRGGQHAGARRQRPGRGARRAPAPARRFLSGALTHGRHRPGLPRPRRARGVFPGFGLLPARSLPFRPVPGRE